MRFEVSRVLVAHVSVPFLAFLLYFKSQRKSPRAGGLFLFVGIRTGVCECECVPLRALR